MSIDHFRRQVEPIRRWLGKAKLADFSDRLDQLEKDLAAFLEERLHEQPTSSGRHGHRSFSPRRPILTEEMEDEVDLAITQALTILDQAQHRSRKNFEELQRTYRRRRIAHALMTKDYDAIKSGAGSVDSLT